MSRPTFVIVFLLSICGILVLIRTFLLAEIGVLNAEYATYNEELEIVRKQNILMRQEVLNYQSLTNIEQRAKDYGFTTVPVYP